ncbi:MAG: CapA family protein, partial [Clostridia bacterium]|nr:CapA family protein [Clostridia bacterium]MBO5671020.1 CapA family protein [Clostridia bacterium]
MNKTTDSNRRLWWTMGLLALAILLAIVIDSLSFPTETAADAIATDTPDISTTTADPPENASNTVRLTILGECAPGSPFATTAYGSLNALAAEMGTAYFFSDLHSILAGDDLTITSNTCVFADSADFTAFPSCAAPTSSASVYADGGVDVVVDFAETVVEAAESTSTALTKTGITVVDGGSAQFFSYGNIRIALFSTEITKNTDHSALLTTISETATSADYMILYFYGGEENSHTVETWMRNALYTFADTGVDLLVGVGNGVLRPCEYYGNSVIAYSLGTVINGSQLVPENATALLQV